MKEAAAGGDDASVINCLQDYRYARVAGLASFSLAVAAEC